MRSLAFVVATLLSASPICAGFFAGAPSQDPPPMPIQHRTNVDIIGTLETGIVAIGGETTGTQITSQGGEFGRQKQKQKSEKIVWELDLKDEKLLKLAEKLHEKDVRVKGQLIRVKGVEIKERWIVLVDVLERAKPDE